MSHCQLFEELIVPVDDALDPPEEDTSLGVWRARLHLERCATCRESRARLRAALATLDPSGVAPRPGVRSLIRVSDLAHVEPDATASLSDPGEASASPGRWALVGSAVVALVCLGLAVNAGNGLDLGLTVSGGRAPEQVPDLMAVVPSSLLLLLTPLASLGFLVPFFVSGLFCRNGQCLA